MRSLFFLVTGLFAFDCFAKSVDVSFNWIVPSTAQIQVSMYKPKSIAQIKVGEMGPLSDKIKENLGIPIDKSLSVWAGPGQLLYLVVENKSENVFRFGVAPHAANPVEAVIDMNFKCLCYGHIYEVQPHKSWYRVLKIQVDSKTDLKQIELKHTIYVPVKLK